MVSRGKVSEDVAYVLLETPLVPRLDLSDCRPTELPVLPETTPTQLSVLREVTPTQLSDLGSGDKGGSGQRQGFAPLSLDRDKAQDRVPVLPRAPVRGIKAQIPATEVRTLVVDMRDLDKHSVPNTDRTEDNDDDSSDEIILEDHVPSRTMKRIGGVLKGGGDYISTGEPKSRPRVSFLLDAAPGQGHEGGAMQIRVYAKPPQVPPSENDSYHEHPRSHSSQHHPPAHHHHYSNAQHGDAALLNGLPPKRFRPHGSADRRHSASSYRQQIRQMQAEAKLHEAYAAAVRSAEGGYRLRHRLYEDSYSLPSTPQLPSVTNGSQSNRRVPLFSFKRKASQESLNGSQTHSQREERNRKHFILTQTTRPGKGHVRFQEEMSVDRMGKEEFKNLHSRHVEPRSINNQLGTVGTYSIVDHPSRTIHGKPPIPRSSHGASAGSVEVPLPGHGHTRVTSASSRTGKVREWLSVDSVRSFKNRQRPSTVSSASSSTRSRDIHSAQQHMAGSSRVSSASVKAASDPGVELENMDLVTLNLMARRCKGPSRYRYLAKLRSLNLNTPRPLT